MDKFGTFWWNPSQAPKVPGSLMQPNSKLLQSLRLSYSIAAWAQVHAQHNAAFMKKVEVLQATGMKHVLTFKMQGVCPEFSLNLAADSSDITFSPTPGSLKIGSIGKLDMYMQAPGSESSPCIAWLIPTSQDAEEVTVQLIKNEDVVNCKSGAKIVRSPWISIACSLCRWSWAKRMWFWFALPSPRSLIRNPRRSGPSLTMSGRLPESLRHRRNPSRRPTKVARTTRRTRRINSPTWRSCDS